MVIFGVKPGGRDNYSTTHGTAQLSNLLDLDLPLLHKICELSPILLGFSLIA